MKRLILITVIMVSTSSCKPYIPPDSEKGVYLQNHGGVCDGKVDDTEAIEKTEYFALSLDAPVMIVGDCKIHAAGTTGFYFPSKMQ